jgi:hypothetical protein
MSQNEQEVDHSQVMFTLEGAAGAITRQKVPGGNSFSWFTTTCDPDGAKLCHLQQEAIKNTETIWFSCAPETLLWLRLKAALSLGAPTVALLLAVEGHAGFLPAGNNRMRVDHTRKIRRREKVEQLGSLQGGGCRVGKYEKLSPPVVLEHLMASRKIRLRLINFFESAPPSSS